MSPQVDAASPGSPGPHLRRHLHHVPSVRGGAPQEEGPAPGGGDGGPPAGVRGGEDWRGGGGGGGEAGPG